MRLVGFTVPFFLACAARPPAAADRGEGIMTTLTYQVGNQGGDGGRTTLTIDSDGGVRVANDTRGVVRTFDGRIPAADVGQLVAETDALGLWTTARRPTAAPGEAPVVIELHTGGAVGRHVDLWEGQLRTGALQPIHDRLDGLVRSVSGGAVY
jgi:hypothetical protein